MSGKYDDILHLSRPVSARHARMSMVDRGAQFSPFAALTGYEDAIQETGRLTGRRIELDESEKQLLDQKQKLLAHSQCPQVAVTYFLPDSMKEGGSYECVSGTLLKIDEYARLMILTDGTRIPLDDIISLE